MTLPRHLFNKISERDGGFCLMALAGCMGEGNVLHHRANRGAGGSRLLDHPANLVLVCSLCNGAAEDAHAITRSDLIERGLRVNKAATNAATLERVLRTPVVYLDGSTWLLESEKVRVPALTSSEWEKKTGILVVDPDGWDRENLADSWAELISERVFRSRCLVSTIVYDPWAGDRDAS